MYEVIAALSPIFLLITLGAGLRHWAFPKAEFWPLAEQFTYYLLFPAMLIGKLANADIDQTTLPTIASSALFMTLLGSLILYLARNHIAANAAAFTSVFQGGIRFNIYIGLACVTTLYGDAGLVIAAITAAVLIPVVNILCVLNFHFALATSQLHWRSLLLAFTRNPLIIGSLVGILLNQTGIGLSPWVAKPVHLLGAAALPLGLLAVGVALDIKALHSAKRELFFSCLVRFLLLPLLLLLALLHQ